jgi:predicted phosphodiesterase
MKLKELKNGTVFNIENTPSYPKLKIENGYVDIRDDIKNVSGNCDEKDVYEMTEAQVAEELGHPEDVISGWIRETRNKYL